MNERDKRLAKQAWTENDWDGHVDIPKLIDLIRADEREACAEIVDKRLKTWASLAGKDKAYQWLEKLSAAIRANRAATASWTLMCKKMVEFEREACAKLCESHVRQPSRLHFAEAIRARGEHD